MCRHWLKIKVTDTGIGISETRLLSLFKKFEQVPDLRPQIPDTNARTNVLTTFPSDYWGQGDASTAVTFGGSGLGLAISKELVELMGGKMGVASAIGKALHFYSDLSSWTMTDAAACGAGVGSCFYFTLPLRRDMARQPRLLSPIPGSSKLQPLLHLTTPRVRAPVAPRSRRLPPPPHAVSTGTGAGGGR